MNERSVATRIHGRYLVIPPAKPGPAPMLVGFHGYSENAEIQLERLRAIPESANWLTISVQGLHRFYQRATDAVVASWMTRQDRENAIADNLAYIEATLDAVAAEWPTIPGVVFAGFSQGVAMAYRAAVDTTRRIAGVIANGGDVPPELAPSALSRIPAALIVRGASDEWYTRSKLAEDESRVRAASVSVRIFEFQGGHEWPDELTAEASTFLENAGAALGPLYTSVRSNR